MKCCCKHSQNTLEIDSTDTDKGEQDDDIDDSCDSAANATTTGDLPYLWYPTLSSYKPEDYVKKLECEIGCLQKAFLSLTTQFARMQFRVRQILQATPSEREELLKDLENIAFQNNSESSEWDELPRIQHDLSSLGDVRRKQNFILEKLRSQLTTLAEAADMEGDDIAFELDRLTEECRRGNSNSNGNRYSNANSSYSRGSRQSGTSSKQATDKKKDQRKRSTSTSPSSGGGGGGGGGSGGGGKSSLSPSDGGGKSSSANASDGSKHSTSSTGTGGGGKRSNSPASGSKHSNSSSGGGGGGGKASTSPASGKGNNSDKNKERRKRSTSPAGSTRSYRK